MRKSKCDSCSNFRYCLEPNRGGARRCLVCTLEDILLSWEEASADIRALKEAAALHVEVGSARSSTPRCVICCKKNAMALDLPYWENICVFCIAEGLGRRLESIRLELKTILQTCANCGQAAEYLWAGQLPLCESCVVSSELTVRRRGS